MNHIITVYFRLEPKLILVILSSFSRRLSLFCIQSEKSVKYIDYFMEFISNLLLYYLQHDLCLKSSELLFKSTAVIYSLISFLLQQQKLLLTWIGVIFQNRDTYLSYACFMALFK